MLARRPFIFSELDPNAIIATVVVRAIAHGGFIAPGAITRGDRCGLDATYDGGDWCECTCEMVENVFGRHYSEGRFYACLEFACIDPAATCVDDDSITVHMVENCPHVCRNQHTSWCPMQRRSLSHCTRRQCGAFLGGNRLGAFFARKKVQISLVCFLSNLRPTPDLTHSLLENRVLSLATATAIQG